MQAMFLAVDGSCKRKLLSTFISATFSGDCSSCNSCMYACYSAVASAFSDASVVVCSSPGCISSCVIVLWEIFASIKLPHSLVFHRWVLCNSVKHILSSHCLVRSGKSVIRRKSGGNDRVLKGQEHCKAILSAGFDVYASNGLQITIHYR